MTVDILALAGGDGAVGAGWCAGESQEIEGIINVRSRELLNNLDLITKGLSLCSLLDRLFLFSFKKKWQQREEGGIRDHGT